MALFSPLPDNYIRLFQVETLYKHATKVYISTFTNVALAVLVLWFSAVPKQSLLIWAGLFYLFTMYRVYQSSRFKNDEHRDQRIDYWQKVFTTSAIVGGLFWGTMGYLFYVPDGSVNQAFIVILVLGLAAGGMAFMAVHLPTFYGFFACLLIPLIVRMLEAGDLPHYVMAGMIIIYALVFLAFSKQVNHILLEGMLLRVDNMELVKKLTQEKEAAEQANIAKSKFLAAASHDLRQPLHALTLLAGALAERIHYQEVKDIVDKIRAAVSALENLFNALLDISKLDSGVLQPCIEEFQLKPLFERIENDHRPEAEKKNISFDVEDCGNVIVKSDSILLERILRNFVSNAIRYTSIGSVTLRCEKHNGDLAIVVTDTGLGIPEEMQNAIFHEYVQLDNPERNRNKGLGLGLAIVHRIASLLGHEIRLQSVEGHGSQFSVIVPYRIGIKTPAPGPALQEFSKDLHHLSVLVIDDEVTILDALKVLLEGWGCQVYLAETVKEARQHLADNNLVPDAVISDYRLRDGITGVEAIKAVEAIVGHELPAILITGDMEVSTGNGISEAYRVLYKPVQPARLRAFLKHVENIKKQQD